MVVVRSANKRFTRNLNRGSSKIIEIEAISRGKEVLSFCGRCSFREHTRYVCSQSETTIVACVCSRSETTTIRHNICTDARTYVFSCYHSCIDPMLVSEPTPTQGCLMSCLTGHFLIASPYLSDRNFFRSVVLIVSHDHEHAFGLLLNRPGHEPLADVWSTEMGEVCGRDERLRCGGPLKGPLMLLHHDRATSDSRIIPGVYISTTQEAVTASIRAVVTPAIPIQGYSGWGPGQLESELEVGGWMTWPASERIVFTHPDEMWNMASAQITEAVLPAIGQRHAPTDPSMN